MAGATPGQQKWTPPGARRRHITIQQQQTATGTRTGLGFLPGTWSTVLTTWAKVTVRQVYSFAAAGPTQEPIAKALYLLNIRYVPRVAILAGMRIQDGANYYLVQNVVDVDELHRELTLFCSQIPASTAEEQ